MELHLNFQFNQANLQDFVDCRRRFRLRSVENRSWPAVQTEPVMENERQMQMGALFHRLLHQYLLGIPVQSLEALIDSDELESWWRNFLAHAPEEVRSIPVLAGRPAAECIL